MMMKELAKKYLDALEEDRYKRNAAFAALAAKYYRQNDEHLWRSKAEKVAKEIVADD